MKENALIIFLKYPKVGEVKTRLAAVLGNAQTHQLYKCFLTDIAVMTHKVNAQILIAYSGPANASFADFPGVPSIRQRGSDIGERMFFAFEEVLTQGFERVALIGSDAPDLPASMINDAFEILRSVDIVLGPSTDGGYYLAACKRGSLRQSMFSDIPWSTGRVFSETLQRIDDAGLASAELQPWSDIDDFDDLKNFYMRNRQSSSKVVQYLDSVKFLRET
ncbi:MAG: TIGR04282 family arsenosugar biosynthesis glycosyltransferase [Smithellaceae bacterium]